MRRTRPRAEKEEDEEGILGNAFSCTYRCVGMSYLIRGLRQSVVLMGGLV